MGLRFSRRVALFPGVRLNFSRSGISASIGPRGASLTVGPRGSAINLGIPGTGLSFRHQLSNTDHANAAAADALPHSNGTPVMPLPASDMTAIQSASVRQLTSDSLTSFKDLIKQVIAERGMLQYSIQQVQKELVASRRRLWLSENWFFGLFLKYKLSERKNAVEAKTKTLHKLEQRLEGTFIDADFALDVPTKMAFDEVVKTFENVASCVTIWDIVSDRYSDRKITRSAASRSIDRVNVTFSTCTNPVLQIEAKVLQLKNANGADILIYPGFIYMQNADDIAIIDLRDIEITYSPLQFVEEEQVPSDTTIVGHAWAKCNKDGSRDRRFTDNYQIPIAVYGKLRLENKAGLNEEYQFSSADKAELFARSLINYQTKLRLFGECPDAHALRSSNVTMHSDAQGKSWFYEVLGEQIGPIASTEMLELAKRGVIVCDTRVREGTDGEWVSADHVQGLFP